MSRLKNRNKYLVFGLLVVAAVFIAAGNHSLPAARLSAPLVLDSIAPQLPDAPFDYTDIFIPGYIQQSTDSFNTPFLPLLNSITNAGAALGRV